MVERERSGGVTLFVDSLISEIIITINDPITLNVFHNDVRECR